MIYDCRAINRLFKFCPSCPMGTGASWSEVVLTEGCDMFISSSDIKDYFYEVAVPESLSAFFGLDDVPESLVAELTGTADGGNTPFLTVLPMGWSWSFFFAQLIHVQQVGEAVPELADRILDDISPPERFVA